MAIIVLGLEFDLVQRERAVAEILRGATFLCMNVVFLMNGHFQAWKCHTT